jgi:hypothetical protein
MRERRDGGGRRPTAAAGGERRRDSPATPIQGSGARFDAREASTRRAQDSGSILGGGSGGDAAARALGAAVRSTDSGDGPRATGCTGTATRDAGGFFTSLHGPGCAP